MNKLHFLLYDHFKSFFNAAHLLNFFLSYSCGTLSLIFKVFNEHAGYIHKITGHYHRDNKNGDYYNKVHTIPVHPAHPEDGKAMRLSGIVLQKTHTAAGFFLYFPPTPMNQAAPSGVSGGMLILPAQ